MSARSPSFIVFDFHHWRPLVTNLPTPAPSLVREFYSNIYDIGEDFSFNVYLSGKHLHVTPDYVAKTFGIPRVPNPECPLSAATAPTGSMLLSCISPSVRGWLI